MRYTETDIYCPEKTDLNIHGHSFIRNPHNLQRGFQWTPFEVPYKDFADISYRNILHVLISSYHDSNLYGSYSYLNENCILDWEMYFSSKWGLYKLNGSKNFEKSSIKGRFIVTFFPDKLTVFPIHYLN